MTDAYTSFFDRLEEEEGLLLTPYEKNLEVWRQLWRVIERSRLVVQIVDARNPLLFRSADLDKYVKDVDPRKGNLLLINKADFLTKQQR
jgi:large subunit GTPase 1